MSSSLADQLVKAGLATKEQAHKTRQKKTKAKKSGQAAKIRKEVDAHLAAQRQAKKDADAKQNAAQQAKREARAVNGFIDQQLKAHKVDISAGDQAFQFTLHGKIRPVYVTAEQRKGIAERKLAIVVHRERANLVPIAVGEKIAAKAPRQVWLVEKSDRSADKPAEDDPYAGYEVPDDLVW